MDVKESRGYWRRLRFDSARPVGAGARPRAWTDLIRPGRPRLLAGALLAIILACLFAAFPPTPPQFDPSGQGAAGPLSLAWWGRPLERNPGYRPPVTTWGLNAVFFRPSAGGRSGWAVGGNGLILHTDDGGQTWAKRASGVSSDLSSIAMGADGRAGWAVGAYGVILHTADGGQTWAKQASGVSSALTSIAMAADGRAGWAVGWDGVILHTTDGGQTWAKQASGVSTLLYSIAMAADGRAGWAVGGNGLILHTADGGQTWAKQASGVSSDLSSIAMAADGRAGWAVGRYGVILHTTDGGQTWATQTSGVSTLLYSIAMAADGRAGWAVGGNGLILHTADGGQTWAAQAVYRKYSAPWTLLGLLLALGVFVWSVQPRRPPPRVGIEEIAVSDNPVERAIDDRLGYGPLVARLRQFIANPKTLPPMVISVQGAWGAGKSSLMRMLQDELRRGSLARRAVARTVWFNAWHHQKEEVLLAYLLEAVRRQAAPPMLSLDGLGFRARLVWLRLTSRLDEIFGLTLGLVFIAVAAGAAGRALGALPGAEAAWLDAAMPWLKRGAPITGPLLGAAGLMLAVTPFRAFRSMPEDLANGAASGLKRVLGQILTLPRLIGRTDVRQEFEDNLRDVVEALKPSKLVVFLDDLDRCRPDRVIQVLEAVNFLSSVAGCFIFLGADYRKVETLVSMELERAAVAEQENMATATPLPVAEVRLAYARDFMRKLVNLRLNLPKATSDHYAGFLTLERAPTRRFWRQLRSGLLAAALLVAIFAVVASLFPMPAPTPTAGAPPPVVAGTAGRQPTRTMPTEAAAPAPALEASPPEAAEPDRELAGRNPADWAPLAVALTAIVITLAYFAARPVVPADERESEAFAAALKDNAERLAEKLETPRELRRFLNYLRLVAAPGDEATKARAATIRQTLDAKGRPPFDAQMVDLAVAAATGAGQSEADDSVRALFLEGCALFGIDPASFQPL